MKLLQTPRLTLKQIQQDDCEFIQEYLADPERTKYLPLERPYTSQEATNWFDGRIEHWRVNNFGTFIITLKDTHTQVGYCGIEYVKDTSFVDIRYGLLQSAWGKGCAVEAALNTLKFGFEECILPIIFGAAVKSNTASIKVLGKLGMTRDDSFNCYGDIVSPLSVTKEKFAHTLSSHSSLITSVDKG